MGEWDAASRVHSAKSVSHTFIDFGEMSFPYALNMAVWYANRLSIMSYKAEIEKFMDCNDSDESDDKDIA